MYRLLSIFSMLLAASNMAAHSNSTITTDTTHIQTAIVQTADESALITDTPCDTCCDNVGCTYWIKQIINNGFHIHDPAICYPKFPRFCLEVYNWGDRTFNSYDNNYVVGTGKNWKLQGKSYNWMETSMMFFPKSEVNMHSDLYSDAGFSLSFMAVSAGYMWNTNKLFSDPTNRRTFSLDFTCSRFSLSYQSVSSTGGMILTRFGDYNDGHHIRYKFSDCSTNSKTFDAYWFFNNYQYSQAAAYSYSKYQLQNAGTALVGFNFTEQHMRMDFNSLPAEMLIHSPLSNNYYTLDYRSYCATGGYAYNWVLKPRRWLLNATGLAAIGYRQLFNSEEHRKARTQLANNFRINLAAVYNHRALFAAFTMRASGFVNYNSDDMTHFNSILSFTAAVGMRF